MTTGILPFDELKRLCHMNTGFFETSQTTENAQMAVVSGNHDDAGLSIGNLQYNYGAADRAQEWFRYMVDNHRAIVDAAFGANITERDIFIDKTLTNTREQRVSWADSISLVDANGEKRFLKEPYKSAFGTMLTSAEGKVKYYAMRDVYYWNPIYEVFRHLGCKSRLAMASLFDTYVNKGRYYPINCLQADFDVIDAGTKSDYDKEFDKIYAINYRGNYDNAVNPNVNAWGNIDQEIFWHGDGVDDGRRGCMANQTGVYYGAVYDPDVQFDLNQETATDEKQGSTGLNVNLGAINVDNIFLGTAQIDKLYLGALLVGGGEIEPYTSTRVPVTQFRTNPASWAGIGAATSVDLAANAPIWVDVQEPFVGCRTYYTTDGSTPTTASPIYTGALKFDKTTVLKVLTVSVFGVAAAVKTVTVNIPAAVTGWRYLKIEGYGSIEEPATTRIVEFQAWEGATNRMLAATILSGQTPNNAGTHAQIKDGLFSTASNAYPLWWTTTPNANIVIDLLAQRPLTKLNYMGYSVSGLQRANRFKILASNTNNGTDWTPIWDNSGGTLGVQPILPAGYEITL